MGGKSGTTYKISKMLGADGCGFWIWRDVKGQVVYADCQIMRRPWKPDVSVCIWPQAEKAFSKKYNKKGYPGLSANEVSLRV